MSFDDMERYEAPPTMSPKFPDLSMRHTEAMRALIFPYDYWIKSDCQSYAEREKHSSPP